MVIRLRRLGDNGRCDWPLGHGTEWNVWPWDLWTPVNIGTVEFAQELDDARFHARLLADIKRLPRDLRRKVVSRLGDLG